MFEEFYNFKLLDKNDSAMKWNKELEIVFMLRGQGVLLMDELDGYYELNKADIFVVNGYQPRDIIMEENALAIALYIDYGFIIESNPEIESPYFKAKSFLYGDEQSSFDVLRKSFAEAFKCYYKQEYSSSIAMRSKIMKILNDLYIYYQSENESLDLTSLDKIRNSVNYINKNYQNNISLKDLSLYTNFSQSYLSALFKQSLGLNISDYIAQVRLNHSVKLLLQDKTITEISYESGFASPNAMISTYNKYKGVTPSQYRKKIRNRSKADKKNSKILIGDETFSTTFKELLNYLNDQEEKVLKQSIKEISLDISTSIGDMSKSWNKVLNVGYARDLLNTKLQGQLIKFQKELGFEYLRFKGILDDDMFLLSLGVDGKEITSYVYINQVIDFILSLNAKPMIEIGHMPSIYAENNNIKMRQSSCFSVPKSQDKWYKVISDLMGHIKKRYGEDVASDWIISPWITVEYNQFSAFTLNEYERTYVNSYKAIKRNLPNVIIAGPGTSINQLDILTWYLKMIKKNDIQIDVITFKSYEGIKDDEEGISLKLRETSNALPFAVSKDENYIKTSLDSSSKVLKLNNMNDIPIIIEEWSNNIWQRDLCNDTIFKSAYIFKTILENDNIYTGIAYHSFSDQMDEIAPVSDEFSGGFGLFTQKGIAKSAYYAFKLLSKMGDKFLAKGENYFITSSDRNIQIYIYNYTNYDTLYRYRHITNLSQKNRYGVFNDKSSIVFNFQLSNFLSGEYEIIHRSITKEQGSAYDTWVAIGSPEELSEDEIEYIKASSLPSYFKENENINDILNLSVKIKPHEVGLIEIIYKGQ